MSRAHFRSSAAPQRGQALVLALALLFAGGLGLFFMFSAGQVSAARQRLDNAADAAAWSAALWRARVMNYAAYANRAIVAQEAAVAQAVTLTAWAKYFETFTRTASVLAEPMPPVATLLETAAALAGVAREFSEQAGGEEVLARSFYKQVLEASQEVFMRAADTFALGAVANEVARANDPAFFAFALPDAGEFARMTRRWSGDDRARLAGVVEDSLDPFVKGPRTLDLTLWLLPSLCFGQPAVGPEAWFQALHKRGGTTMAPALERWEAADTASLHDWRPKSGFLGIFRGCRQQESLPLGWGAAQAGDPQTGGALLANPGDVAHNASAANLAQADLTTAGHPGFDAYPGMSTVRDLDYAALTDDRYPTSRVAVLARTEGAEVRTANRLNVGVGRLRLTDHFASGRLWSVSAAEVYFRRPAGAPARAEYASLYAPYWQVRLAEPTAAERASAQAYVR